jgi:nucleoside-diphosphate-sugar epimerase
MITARLALVYGAGQASDFLVPALVESCLARRPLTLNRPHDRRDLLHVDDVVDALLLLAEADVPTGTIVNIGSGEPVSVAEVAALALEITGADARLLEAKAQANPVTLLLATQRMERLTGWKRRISLRDGLASVIVQSRATAMIPAEPAAA